MSDNGKCNWLCARRAGSPEIFRKKHLCKIFAPKIFTDTFLIFFKLCFFNIFVAEAFISPSNTQTMHIKLLYTTALLCFPKNLMPWRDSNPGLLVPEADAMSSAPRRQGVFKDVT
jgi:hypothetical protein